MAGFSKRAPYEPAASNSSRTDVGASAPVSTQVKHPTTNGDAKYQRLFESNVVGIIVADLSGGISDANDFFLRLLGHTRDDLPLRWDDMTPPEWRDLDQDKITEVLAIGEAVPWEKEYFHKNGLRVSVLVTVALLEGTGDKCIALVLDQTKRKQVEKRLVKRKAQLQALAAELVRAEEEERRRIAKGLHDHIGHALATARMKLGMLQEARVEPATTQVEEIRELLDTAIAATRSLTFELSSPILYELGLEAAIKSLGKQTQAQHNVRVHFSTDGQPKPMVENTSVVVYRATRELLFNIIKHAQARNIWLRMERQREHLRMTVADDGVGYDDPGLGGAFDKTGGYGLFNLRQQLDYLGGWVEINSAPGDGTRVVVIAPLD